MRHEKTGPIAGSTDQGRAAESAYPDDNPKTIYGIVKPGISAVPPIAILTMGQAMEAGRMKYGLTNWREAPVTFSTYYNAAQRHLMAKLDGEDFDVETGIDHLGLAMASLGILLDAAAQGTLNDDRAPSPGMTAGWIDHHTKGRKA